MVGIPFENMARVLNTVKCAARIEPGLIQTSIYYPYARTELYRMCEKEGFLTGKRLDSYFNAESILDLPNFSEKQILFAYHNFKEFVSYYIAAWRFSRPFDIVLEKIVDFMWLHQRIYLFSDPVYRFFKKLYKRLRKKR